MPKTYVSLQEREQAVRERNFNLTVLSLRQELKKAQKQKMITQNELAKKSNLGTCTVSNILNPSCDFSKIKIESLKSLCDALGVSLEISVSR